MIYFVVAMFFYLECLFGDIDEPMGIWLDLNGLFCISDEPDCNPVKSAENVVRYILVSLLAHQFFIECY